MIGTEQRLWKVLKRSADAVKKDSFTRIETATVDGVSDVEYVLYPWHGWVELKTVTWPRQGKPFSLHTPFTLAQCTWLLNHDNVGLHMRSWLLIGVVGARTWKRFILVPANLSTFLLHVRKAPAHEKLLGMAGIISADNTDDIVYQIRRTL
jgi:hypothetical protein